MVLLVLLPIYHHHQCCVSTNTWQVSDHHCVLGHSFGIVVSAGGGRSTKCGSNERINRFLSFFASGLHSNALKCHNDINRQILTTTTTRSFELASPPQMSLSRRKLVRLRNIFVQFDKFYVNDTVTMMPLLAVLSHSYSSYGYLGKSSSFDFGQKSYT